MNLTNADAITRKDLDVLVAIDRLIVRSKRGWITLANAQSTCRALGDDVKAIARLAKQEHLIVGHTGDERVVIVTAFGRRVAAAV